jgi:competence protein ComEA
LALGKRISINQAELEDLMVLPGIGPERAASIVAWREQHGPFIQTKDLQNVPGIGPLIFQRLADSIEVSYSPQE